jgi:lipopolysaccharide/colanic/teichoic acid biosynthesis glycosyltransferase
MSLQDRNSFGGIAQTAIRDEADPVIGLDQWTKRIIDVIMATTGLILFAPILLLAAIAITLESGSPIFIRQTLPPCDNQATQAFKFRVACSSRRAINPGMTRVGQILSLTGIDELPLLINVLRGEVSIVGRRNVRRWPTSIC